MKILEVVTEHSTPFKILIEVLKEILPETNIEFRCDNPDRKGKDDELLTDDNVEASEETETEQRPNKSGMRIMQVDSTKTVLINLKLDAKKFAKFKCKSKKLVLGVNLVYFHKLIKSMDKNDNLTLFVEHDDKNTLQIKMDNPEEKKDTAFRLKLLDLRNQPMSIPAIEFEAVIIINSIEFHKLCRDMYGIADHIEIKCLNDQVMFSCKGDNADRKTTYRVGGNDDGDGITIRHGSTQKDKKESPQIVQGIYELRNLVLFSKCASLCNDIEIYMKNNYPLVIKYTVATLGRILLCLTPIKNDISKDSDTSDDCEYYSENDTVNRS